MESTAAALRQRGNGSRRPNDIKLPKFSNAANGIDCIGGAGCEAARNVRQDDTTDDAAPSIPATPASLEPSIQPAEGLFKPTPSIDRIRNGCGHAPSPPPAEPAELGR